MLPLFQNRVYVQMPGVYQAVTQTRVVGPVVRSPYLSADTILNPAPRDHVVIGPALSTPPKPVARMRTRFLDRAAVIRQREDRNLPGVHSVAKVAALVGAVTMLTGCPDSEVTQQIGMALPGEVGKWAAAVALYGLYSQYRKLRPNHLSFHKILTDPNEREKFLFLMRPVQSEFLATAMVLLGTSSLTLLSVFRLFEQKQPLALATILLLTSGMSFAAQPIFKSAPRLPEWHKTHPKDKIKDKIDAIVEDVIGESFGVFGYIFDIGTANHLTDEMRTKTLDVIVATPTEYKDELIKALSAAHLKIAQRLLKKHKGHDATAIYLEYRNAFIGAYCKDLNRDQQVRALNCPDYTEIVRTVIKNVGESLNVDSHHTDISIAEEDKPDHKHPDFQRVEMQFWRNNMEQEISTRLNDKLYVTARSVGRTLARDSRQAFGEFGGAFQGTQEFDSLLMYLYDLENHRDPRKRALGWQVIRNMYLVIPVKSWGDFTFFLKNQITLHRHRMLALHLDPDASHNKEVVAGFDALWEQLRLDASWEQLRRDDPDGTKLLPALQEEAKSRSAVAAPVQQTVLDAREVIITRSTGQIATGKKSDVIDIAQVLRDYVHALYSGGDRLTIDAADPHARADVIRDIQYLTSKLLELLSVDLHHGPHALDTEAYHAAEAPIKALIMDGVLSDLIATGSAEHLGQVLHTIQSRHTAQGFWQPAGARVVDTLLQTVVKPTQIKPDDEETARQTQVVEVVTEFLIEILPSLAPSDATRVILELYRHYLRTRDVANVILMQDRILLGTAFWFEHGDVIVRELQAMFGQELASPDRDQRILKSLSGTVEMIFPKLPERTRTEILENMPSLPGAKTAARRKEADPESEVAKQERARLAEAARGRSRQ